jgi:nitronate monooxygenase
VPLPPVLAHLSLPIIGSPLFIISNPRLVIEQCKAGIVGSMPALNARPASQLEEWLAEITEGLAAHDRAHPGRPAAPFAISQIAQSNDRLDHDMQLCAKYKVPVITSLGARTDVNDAVHDWGNIVLHDIVKTPPARRSEGADGLIAVRRGGGGRRQSRSPWCRRSVTVRRPGGAVGRHFHRRRRAGSARHGCGLAYRLASSPPRRRGLSGVTSR